MEKTLTKIRKGIEYFDREILFCEILCITRKIDDIYYFNCQFLKSRYENLSTLFYKYNYSETDLCIMINDYEQIDEYLSILKKDLFEVFRISAIDLIYNLNIENLISLKSYLLEIINNECYLSLAGEKLKEFISLNLNLIEKNSLQQEIKLVPYDYLANLINSNLLTFDDLMKGFKQIKSVYKQISHYKMDKELADKFIQLLAVVFLVIHYKE